MSGKGLPDFFQGYDHDDYYCQSCGEVVARDCLNDGWCPGCSWTQDRMLHEDGKKCMNKKCERCKE